MAVGTKTDGSAVSLGEEVKLKMQDSQLKQGETETGPTRAKVLLVDENKSAVRHLLTYLRRLGCVCSLTSSHQEACDLFRKEKFDLILSRFAPIGGSCHELITLLAGTRASFFYFYAVEHGCWWIPRVRFGQECWGDTALQPRQFACALKKLIQKNTGTVCAENVVSIKN